MDPLARQVPKLLVHELGAGGSQVEQELLDGVLGASDHSASGAHGIAFDQDRNDAGPHLGAEYVRHDATNMLEKSGSVECRAGHLQAH